jgi:hypothetical protein
VIGGKLQFMLPLRSIKNSKLEGSRWLSNAALAQASPVITGVALGTVMSGLPLPVASSPEPLVISAPALPVAPPALCVLTLPATLARVLAVPPAPAPEDCPLLGEHAAATQVATHTRRAAPGAAPVRGEPLVRIRSSTITVS